MAAGGRAALGRCARVATAAQQSDGYTATPGLVAGIKGFLPLWLILVKGYVVLVARPLMCPLPRPY